MTWHRNNGGPPRTDNPVRVKFRDGTVSKNALLPGKWNWSDRDYAFDILEWKEEK